MSLFITSLNSGSNGNCYYIGNENEALLVDAGISCREIEKRMKRIGLNISKLKAIFISHEHNDHIKGVEMISKKYRLPVYVTPLTVINGRIRLDNSLQITFKSFESIQIGSLRIIAFPKSHDAADPNSFVVECNNIKVGIFTDIGFVCKNLIQHFSMCHAAFLETNYDEQMLNEGNYPFHLKQRIKSGSGHLSNMQALELFKKHRPPFMSHLILSHLSKNNNKPQLAEELFNTYAGNIKIIVASRDHEMPVYAIDCKNNFAHKRKNALLFAEQLSFSFT